MATGPSGGPGSAISAIVRYGIPTVFSLVALLMGLRMVVSGSTIAGLSLIVVFSVSGVLAARGFIRTHRSSGGRFQASGDISNSELDYVIWIYLGAPVILGIVLVLLAATGSLDG